MKKYQLLALFVVLGLSQSLYGMKRLGGMGMLFSEKSALSARRDGVTPFVDVTPSDRTPNPVLSFRDDYQQHLDTYGEQLVKNGLYRWVDGSCRRLVFCGNAAQYEKELNLIGMMGNQFENQELLYCKIAAYGAALMQKLIRLEQGSDCLGTFDQNMVDLIEKMIDRLEGLAYEFGKEKLVCKSECLLKRYNQLKDLCDSLIVDFKDMKERFRFVRDMVDVCFPVDEQVRFKRIMGYKFAHESVVEDEKLAKTPKK